MENASLGHPFHSATDDGTRIDASAVANVAPFQINVETAYKIAYPPSSTRIATADVVAILACHYDIVNVQRCELERASQNEVYRVTLDDGVTVFGRLERLNKFEAKNVPYEFALLTALHNAGQPVCVPIRPCTGDWTVAVAVPERLKRFALFKEVKGACPASNEASLFASGVALGKLHTASTNRLFPDMPIALSLETQLEQTFDAILSSHLIDAVTLQAFIALKGRLAHLLRDSAADRDGWRCGHYHSDPYNNRLAQSGADGETTIAFIDFDDARPGYLAIDLSDFLEKVLSAYDPKQAIDAETSAKWAAFMRGYSGVATVDDRELKHLPLLIALRTQRWTAMFLKNDGLIGRYDQLNVLKSGYGKARYVLGLVCTRTAIRHDGGNNVRDMRDITDVDGPLR